MKKKALKICIVILLLILICIVGLLVFKEQANKSDQKQEEAKNTETQSEETESVSEEPEPVETEITVSLAGDCSIGKLSVHDYEGSLYEYYDNNGADYFFKNVQDYFGTDSMTLVNFEGVLTDCDVKVDKMFNIKGRPEFISVLPAGSIEAVSFGNNHREDYGKQSTDDTVALFNEKEIAWSYDDNYGIYTTPEGIRIGLVSVNQVYDGKKVEEYLKNGIEYLKGQGVDLVFCSTHWGIETHHYPDSYQKELGRLCIDWGADLVVGSHPHVLQGFDYYNGKYIIYSLGNFCFGGNRNPKDKNTMIVQVSYHFTDGVLDQEPVFKAIPCTISSVDSKNDFCPTPATGDRYTKIISLLNDYSKDFGVKISDDGTITHQ